MVANKRFNMKLEDLVGDRFLTGVDISHETVKNEEVATVLFTLDGVTYKALEDPSDGYRSYLDDLEVTTQKVKNTFPPQRVMCKMRGGDNDILEVFNFDTSNLLLAVGTENTDDWYPYCVIDWNPENLNINSDYKTLFE